MYLILKMELDLRSLLSKKERDAYVKEMSMFAIGSAGKKIPSAQSVISKAKKLLSKAKGNKKNVEWVKAKKALEKQISEAEKQVPPVKQQGGYLQGKSHKHGGIAAVIGGQEPVELEGGEYIIKKSSVDKLGKDVLAKINKEGRIPTMAQGGPAKYWQGQGGPGGRKLTVEERVEELKKKNDPDYKPKGSPKTAIEKAYERDAKIKAKIAKEKAAKDKAKSDDVTKFFGSGKTEKVVSKKKKKVVKPVKDQYSNLPITEAEKNRLRKGAAEQNNYIGSGMSEKDYKALVSKRQTSYKSQKIKDKRDAAKLKGKGSLGTKSDVWEKKLKDEKTQLAENKKLFMKGQEKLTEDPGKVDDTKVVTETPVKKKGKVDWSKAPKPGTQKRTAWYKKNKLKFDDTVPGYNRDGTKKTAKKVVAKPVVEKKKLTPSEIDEQAQQDVLAGGKKRMKKQPPLKDRIPQSDFTKRMKKKTALDLRTDKQKKQAKWIKSAKKDTPYFSPEVRKKRAESAKKAEKEKAKRMKRVKRSKTLFGKTINKMKDLLNKKGKNKRDKLKKSGVGLDFQQGGYMPNAPIPAPPKFRQGMRMMGHGGETSVSNNNAAGGDPVAVHSHSGYKAGE